MGAKRISVVFLSLTLAAGCVATSRDYMASDEYQSRPVLSESLFPADQAVLDDEAIERILSSRIVLPPQSSLAVLPLVESDRWRWWVQDGSFLLEETVARGFLEKLVACDRISVASVLPAMLTPERRTVPHLRAAAARYQADLLLVFRVASGSYQKERLLGKDEVKAYSTVEAVLLDVRTGIVPFSSLVTRTVAAKREKDDLGFSETVHRARLKAKGLALAAVVGELQGVLESLPNGSAPADSGDVPAA